MMHIVSLDLWMKLLAEFICCLHWFNPLVYFLEHKVNYLSETSCDEKVIRGCTDEECERYINLLDKNKGDNKLKFPFGNTFRGSGVEVEKRIVFCSKIIGFIAPIVKVSLSTRVQTTSGARLH